MIKERTTQMPREHEGDARPENTEAVSPSPIDFGDGELLMRVENDTLYVTGDVDLYQAPQLRAEAEPFIRNTAMPRIDLSNVPFLDSAGLATLLYLARQARGQEKDLRLVATGGPRRVLKITGIDQVLHLED